MKYLFRASGSDKMENEQSGKEHLFIGGSDSFGPHCRTYSSSWSEGRVSPFGETVRTASPG